MSGKSERAFRVAAVGGFNRQDVLEYISVNSRERKEEVEAYRIGADKLRAEREKFKSQVQQLQSECENLKKGAVGAADNSEFDLLKSQYADLKAENSDLLNKQQTLSENNNAEKLDAVILSQKEEIKKLEQQAEENNNLLKSQFSQLQDENNSLKEQLNGSAATESQLADYNLLKSQFSQLQDENNSLKEQLNGSAATESQLADYNLLKSQFSQLQDENNSLKEQLNGGAATESQLADYNLLKSQFSQLQDENINLKEQSTKEQDIKNLANEEKLQQLAQQLLQFDALKSQYLELKNECNDYKNRINAHSVDVEKMNQLEQQLLQYSVLRRQYIDMKACCENYKIQITNLSGSDQQLKQLEQQFSEISENYNNLNDKLSAINTQYDELASENHILRERVGDYEEEFKGFNDVKSKISDLEMRAYSRAEEIEAEAVQNANKEREVFNSQIDEVKFKYDTIMASTEQSSYSVVQELDRMRDWFVHFNDMFNDVEAAIKLVNIEIKPSVREFVPENFDEQKV